MDAMLSNMGVLGDVDSFGPQLWGQFDFTLMFEHTILTILPTSILIIASLVYLLCRFNSPVYVSGGFLLWAKLAVIAALLGVEIASLVLWSIVPTYRSSVSLAASSLSCVSTFCIVAVVNLDHRQSLQSSTFVSVYLSLTTLLDIVKARSYFFRSGLQAMGGLSSAAATIKFLLLILEEIPKRTQIRDSALRNSVSKESVSGFWNRAMFLWLNETLLLGFRDIIHVSSLGQLGREFSAKQLSDKFRPVWTKYQRSSHSLIQSCFLTLMWPFIAVVFPRLLYIAFSFSQPFLLHRIVSFIGEENPSTSVRNGLIGATVLIYLGQAITKASYNHMNYRFITFLRGILVSEILKKTLAIDQHDAKEFTAATLMSTDVEGIAAGLPQFHDIWASLIEFTLGLYFLTTIVGPAAVLIILPGLILAVLAFEIGRRMPIARMAWNKEVENRVSHTSNMLQQIQCIRLTGLRPIVTDYIQALRVTEMNTSIEFRALFVVLKASAMLCYQLTPIVIVTAALFWTRFTGGLEPVQAFTTLAFIVNTALPMVYLTVSYPIFTSILGCFQRIQKYLLLEERQDNRETISDLVLRNSEKLEGQSGGQIPSAPKHSIELQLPQPPIAFIDASISPALKKEALLMNINISLTRTELAAVVGRTGSGKSTFLRAIVGEANVLNGLVYVEQRRIAFCDQSAWVRNITIQENIVGSGMYDKDWYETVLDVCLLNEDLRQLPQRDQTMAGNGGSNLSGGQRQRVALARAIYSQASLVVLDNVFSALDQATADAIFARLFGPNGLLRRLGSTVVMTTHNGIQHPSFPLRFRNRRSELNSCDTVEYIKSADKIFVVEDGLVKSASNSTDCRLEIGSLISEGTSGSVIDDPRANEQPRGELTKETLEIEGGDSERQRGDMRLYSYYFTSVSKWLWVTFLFTIILTSLTERLPEIFIRIWLEVGPQNKVYLTGYILLGVSCALVGAVTMSMYYLKIVPSSSESLHRALLDSLMKSTLSFLSRTSTGSLLNLFSQDMSLISQDLPIALFYFLYNFFLMLTDLGIIATGAKYAAPIIPFTLLLLYIIQFFYLRTSRQMRHLDLEAKTPLYTQFTEVAAGLAHIRSFGWQVQCLSQGLSFLDYSQKPFYYMFCIQRWLELVLDLSVLGIATLLVSIALTQGTTQTAIGLALLNVMQFSSTISVLAQKWIELETSLGAIARLRSFTKNTPAEQDCNDTTLPPECLKHGAIEMVDVQAVYDSSGSSPKVALDKINLDIKAGQKVAVVGRTGSGKSSLLLTLLNFLEYTGVVKIDGVDISEIPRQYLRSHITTIPQDLVELPGSVRHNILPMTETKTDQIHSVVINEALERIGLLDYVNLRGGLDASILDMGFSHGQKQLLAVARAILHKLENNTRILFVDEATSGMDSETADEIQQLLEEVFGDSTMITISHRPEIMRNSDIVLHIDDGHVTRMT
ncbi:hypothetical protein QQS21_007459 [Conoideocrella luteorostrata]|uniref:ABC transporter n=1 Tax=Conoideocrella luteorostrata TaxID=1105319 RepID=A0AAJ0CQ13_9HYPO|nr:hypothetical protein QQS21_007459 [Conoideocrella luteorostrata]